MRHSMHAGAVLALAVYLFVANVLPAFAPFPSAKQVHAQSTDEELAYIDADGVIRTKDFTDDTSGPRRVAWLSPVGGYLDATLVDVQGDGDMEIAALRASGSERSLDLYDPVITSGTFDPNQTIGGIPWTLLYTLKLTELPQLIAAGNLDALGAGDEIFFTVDDARPSFLRQVGARDGRNWETVQMAIPDRDWDRVAIGDMDVDGLDEIALVQSADSALTVWRMVGGGNTKLLYEVVSESRKWQWPAMGNWRGDGRELLGMVRLASPPWHTFIIYRYSYSNQEIVDDHGETFSPGPRFIMFGDVNGNGDDEAFMLREVPAGDARPRLIGRNRSTDPLALTEDALTPEANYLHGATGDIDGDGKDEVILVGRGLFRYYMNPDTATTANDTPVSTNQRTLLAGDLDAAGYVQALTLQPLPESVSSFAPAGGQALPQTLTVNNGTSSASLPFKAEVQGNAPWMTLSASGGATPATLNIAFDSARLVPGTYSAVVRLTSTNPFVFDQPVDVPVFLTISPGLLLQPDGLAFVRADCANPSSLETKNVDIVAPPGTSYSVSLAPVPTAEEVGGASLAAPEIAWPSSVPWASALSAAAVAPEVLQVTVDYSKRGTDFAAARAIVVAQVNNATLVRTLPIFLFCADKDVFLPIVDK